MLLIRSSLLARSGCLRIEAIKALSSTFSRLPPGRRDLLPEPLDLGIAAALDPVLGAGDILADLINHGQLLGERLQSGVRCGMDLTHSRGAGCDESASILFVLGPLRWNLA